LSREKGKVRTEKKSHYTSAGGRERDQQQHEDECPLYISASTATGGEKVIT